MAAPSGNECPCSKRWRHGQPRMPTHHYPDIPVRSPGLAADSKAGSTETEVLRTEQKKRENAKRNSQDALREREFIVAHRTLAQIGKDTGGASALHIASVVTRRAGTDGQGEGGGGLLPSWFIVVNDASPNCGNDCGRDLEADSLGEHGRHAPRAEERAEGLPRRGRAALRAGRRRGLAPRPAPSLSRLWSYHFGFNSSGHNC